MPTGGSRALWGRMRSCHLEQLHAYWSAQSELQVLRLTMASRWLFHPGPETLSIVPVKRERQKFNSDCPEPPLVRHCIFSAVMASDQQHPSLMPASWQRALTSYNGKGRDERSGLNEIRRVCRRGRVRSVDNLFDIIQHSVGGATHSDSN